jgi:hypothetical protein
MPDEYNTPFNKDQQRKRRRLSGDAGKGDAPRNNGSEAYRLGFALTKLEKGTPEYENTLKEWRKAVKEGR